MFSVPFGVCDVPAGRDAFYSLELRSWWCDDDGEPVISVRFDYDGERGVFVSDEWTDAGYRRWEPLIVDSLRLQLEGLSDDWGEGSRLYERTRMVVTVGRDARRMTMSELAAFVNGMVHGCCTVGDNRFWALGREGAAA